MSKKIESIQGADGKSNPNRENVEFVIEQRLDILLAVGRRLGLIDPKVAEGISLLLLGAHEMLINWAVDRLAKGVEWPNTPDHLVENYNPAGDWEGVGHLTIDQTSFFAKQDWNIDMRGDKAIVMRDAANEGSGDTAKAENGA